MKYFIQLMRMGNLKPVGFSLINLTMLYNVEQRIKGDRNAVSGVDSESCVSDRNCKHAQTCPFKHYAKG